MSGFLNNSVRVYPVKLRIGMLYHTNNTFFQISVNVPLIVPPDLKEVIHPIILKTINNWRNVFNKKWSHLNGESAKLRHIHAKNVLTCQRALCAYVSTCQCALCAYVPTCQRDFRACVFTCQSALRAYVLTCLSVHVPTCHAYLRAHVPICVACQRTLHAHLVMCLTWPHAHMSPMEDQIIV